MCSFSASNWSAYADTQDRGAASRRVLPAGCLERYPAVI